MRNLIVPVLLLVVLLIGGCEEQVASTGEEADATLQAARPDATDGLSKAGPPSSAVVLFGRAHVGSPFPPPDHDRSFEAKDQLQPRTVVISAGGSVTFRVAPLHYPAVYEPGIGPEDIDTSQIGQAEGCPLPFFEDEEGRIAEGPLHCPADQIVEWTTPPGTFDQPGRYLVLCQILPHFVEAEMYGWVIVK